MSEIGASSIRFASARVIGHGLDMQLLRFVVRAQMSHRACQKCYRSRKHGAGTVLVKGSRLKATVDSRCVVVDRRSRKRRCVLWRVERGSGGHHLRSTTRHRRNTAQHSEDTQRYARQTDINNSTYTERWSKKVYSIKINYKITTSLLQAFHALILDMGNYA